MRGSNPITNHRTRALRRKATDVETKLWSSPRNRALNGFKFVRQAPVGPYIADFLCRERKLIVEVDVSQHEGSTHDGARDQWLLGQGYSVLQVWNGDVYARRAVVLETIVAALEGRLEPQESSEMKFKCRISSLSTC
jgi:very-short-patch-repair endonuclease